MDPAYSRMAAYHPLSPAERQKLTEGIKEAIEDGENDAVSLISGFLIAQLAVWKTTGHLMPLHAADHAHEQRHSPEEIAVMFWFFCGTLLAVAVLQFVEYEIKKHKAFQDKFESDADGRAGPLA